MAKQHLFFYCRVCRGFHPEGQHAPGVTVTEAEETETMQRLETLVAQWEATIEKLLKDAGGVKGAGDGDEITRTNGTTASGA